MINISETIDNVKQVKDNNILFYSVSKREVKNKDFTRLRKTLSILKEAGKEAKGKLFLTFDGYDNDFREIYMIEEIREYVKEIWQEYKYLFYFLSPMENNISIIFACLNDFESFQPMNRNTTNLRIIINQKIRQQIIDAMTQFGLLIDDVDGIQRVLFSFI